MVLFGGRSRPIRSRYGSNPEFLEFNFVSNSWNLVPVQYGTCKARYRHSACYSEKHQCMFITGGLNDQHVTLNDLCMYHFPTQSWNALQVPLDSSALLHRHFAACSSYELHAHVTRIVLFGGMDDEIGEMAKHTNLDVQHETVEMYNMIQQFVKMLKWNKFCDTIIKVQ